MRSLRSILLSVVITLCVLTSSARALTIIYPADKTVIHRSDFLVIKGGEKPPLEAMILEINGMKSDAIDIASPEYQTAFADFLILEPDWEQGKNSLIVHGLAGGKEVATAKADLFYLPFNDTVGMVPPDYRPYVLHTPEQEALCAPCHNMQPVAAQLRDASAENPCASCHKRMLNQKFVHGPEGVFQCVDCHDSTTKPQRWQVTKPILTLCGECHIDKISEYQKSAFVHGPVATGDCTLCHDPHAAEERAQLHAPVNILCLSCHDNIGKSQHVVRGVSGGGHPLDKIADPLNKNREMSCISCHNPHGEATEYFYAGGVKSRFALCSRCHQK